MTCAPYPLHGKDIHQLPPASHAAGFQRHTWATSWLRMGFGCQLHSKATVCLALCGFLATFSNQSFENVCKKSNQLVFGQIPLLVHLQMYHLLCCLWRFSRDPATHHARNDKDYGICRPEIRFHNHMDWFASFCFGIWCLPKISKKIKNMFDEYQRCPPLKN